MKYLGLGGALLAALMLAACERPKDEAADKDAAPAAVESEVAKEPAAVEEVTTEETIVVPPTVSEDAPKAPHKGEPPSPNQPQPIYPDSADTGDAPAAVEETEMTEGVISVPPTVSEDAPKAPHKGEPPSPNQPQPVYPDSAATGDAPAAVEDAEVAVGRTTEPPTVAEGAPKAPRQ